MNVKTVYLETSVLGSLAPRQPADRKRIVKELLTMLDGKRGVRSWNHRHLTRPLKRLQYEAVNQLHGYLKTPLICNPLEVLDELGD